MTYKSYTFEPATKYGILTLKYHKYKGMVNIAKIRLFDNHQYNWHEGIIRNGMLTYHTDQTYDLEANPSSSKLSDYKEVYLDGVLLYKRPWWKIL